MTARINDKNEGIPLRAGARRGLVSCVAASLAILAFGCATAFGATARVFQSTFGCAEHAPGCTTTTPDPYPLLEPWGVAVDESTHDVYVIDSGNHRVEKFNEKGAFVLMFGQDVNPAGISEAEQNVCKMGSLVCQSGIPGNTPGAFVFSQTFGEQGYIAVDNSTGPSHGDVYVADGVNGVVTKFTGEGELVNSWGNNGTGGAANGQLNGASAQPFGNAFTGIAVDDEGDLWVSAGAVQDVFDFSPQGIAKKFKQEGATREFFVPHSVPQPGNPQEARLNLGEGGIAVGRGSVYLSAGTGNSVGFFKFSFADGLEGTVAALGGATGFALDTAGTIYLNHGGAFEVYAGCVPPVGRPGTCEATGSFGGGAHSAGRGQVATDSAASGERDPVYAVNEQADEVLVFSRVTVPGVATGKPAGATTTTATLTGSVNPSGFKVNKCFFEWGETEAYGKKAECEPEAATIPVDSSEHVLHAKIAGLTPGHVYHYRLVAVNENDELEPAVSSGRDVVFGPPAIDSESSSEVAATSATFDASIDPRNLDTRSRVEYLTRAEYEADGDGFSGPDTPRATPIADAGAAAGDVGVSEHVQGLSPSTAYEYRYVAESSVAEGPEAVIGQPRLLRTQGAGAFVLPDGRSWELVSPADKHGASIKPIGGQAPTQAAADGGALTYGAITPTEEGVLGTSDGVQVLSARAPSGVWRSRDLSIEHTSATGVSEGTGTQMRAFAEDLSAAVVQPFGPFEQAVSAQATEQTPYLLDTATGSYTPLLIGCTPEGACPPGRNDTTEPFVPFGEEGQCPAKGGKAICGPVFVGASGDSRHVVIDSQVALTAAAAAGCTHPTACEGLYESSGGSLSFIGAGVLGAQGPAVATVGAGRGAVSEDGSHVFFTREASGRSDLFMRDVPGEKTVQLDVPEAACGSCAGGAVDAEFQGASVDGSRVFFTDTQALTAGAGAYGSARNVTHSAADLYECEIVEDACRLSDLTPSGSVLGSASALSADGSWLYFVANGELAEGAVKGNCPDLEAAENEATLSGERCNLYLRHGGSTQLVAVLSGADVPDWSVSLPGLTSRASPDGRWLAFMSQLPLTGYDNTDAVSGHRDEEVFLFDGASGRLACASCDPTGARPHGVEVGLTGRRTSEPLADVLDVWPQSAWVAGSVPGWTAYASCCAAYQSRYLSDDGRLFFDSPGGLVPRDVNAVGDAYEYEPEGVGGEHAPCGPSAASGSEVFQPGRTVTVEEGSPQQHAVQIAAGCVALISSGASSAESAFLDASETGGRDSEGHEGGGDVFLLTSSQLVPEDAEGGLSVYDAHECSIQAPCTTPPVPEQKCETTEACRSSSAPQPSFFGAPASATFQGPGNPTPPSSGPPPGLAGSHHKTAAQERAEKLTRALKKCRKDRSKKKRQACEKAAHKAYGAKPGKNANRARKAGQERAAHR